GSAFVEREIFKSIVVVQAACLPSRGMAALHDKKRNARRIASAGVEQRSQNLPLGRTGLDFSNRARQIFWTGLGSRRVVGGFGGCCLDSRCLGSRGLASGSFGRDLVQHAADNLAAKLGGIGLQHLAHDSFHNWFERTRFDPAALLHAYSEVKVLLGGEGSNPF